MSTKAEERKALEQIQQIIEQVGGTDSYIGITFEGCTELAAENITNDFADSYKGRWERALKTIETLKKEKAEHSEVVNRLHEKIERTATRLNHFEEACNLNQQRIAALDGKCKDLTAERDAAAERANAAEARAAEQAQELTRLKAMLFDLMYNK